MLKKILFIGENVKSILFKSIGDTLNLLGYDAIFVSPSAKEISAAIESVTITMIYGGTYLEDNTDGIVYLKDYCIENEKKVGIIGFPDEIDKARTLIPEALIFKSYERPINVKELCEKIKEDLEETEVEAPLKHILVVDDSGAMLRTVKSWLSGKYKVSIASSATMAINFLASNKPDLILLDYEMPICSGPQFMAMIHAEENTASIPVIFLTSKGDIESVKQVIKLKPDGYLLKSMKQDEIVSYVDDFFEKRKGLT